jgi:flagellar M-ring protein FliF
LLQAILDYLRRLWQIIKDFWQGIERKDRLRFIAISSVALIGVIIAVSMLTRTTFEPLFTGVEPAELAEVRDILAAGNVRYRIEGSTILIPESQVNEWLLTLANLGYPKSGVSYEYLDRISGFGTSDFEKRMWENINARENLRSIIMNNPSIIGANVIISQPDNSSALFAREVTPVTASVALVTIDTLTPEQVGGIITLVSKGYPNLLPENVMVVDQYMTVLNPRDPTEFDVFAEKEQLKENMQSRFEREILKLLVPIFGADKVRVAVFLELNWDDEYVESITFSPVVGNEDGIIISLQETLEKATGGRQAGQPGADENGWDEPLYAEVGDLGDSWESSIRTINYEVNQMIRRIDMEKGKVVRMYASVTIDSNELHGDLNNERTIQNIIGGVLGIDRANYNTISANILPFDGQRLINEAIAAMISDRDAQAFREFLVRLALIAVLGICLIVIIWRVFKLFHKGPTEAELLEMQRAAEMEDLDEYADLLRLASEDEPLEETKTPERMKIEDFVERSPDMVANLLRNWLNDEPVRRR